MPARRCGKLIVASDEHEVAELEALLAQGRANGVEGLEIVDRAFVAAASRTCTRSPRSISPETGIVDAEALVKALLRTGRGDGRDLPARHARWSAPSRGPAAIALRTERETILAGQVVNAAGLYADEVSRHARRRDVHDLPVPRRVRGAHAGKASLVNALVYPLPHLGHGLGVHLVRTTGGAVWLGPTIRYQDRKDDYESDRLPLEAFLEPARRLLRGVTLDDLRLSGSGIRAKLHPPNESFADFMIRRDQRESARRAGGGHRSPGLTSCLAVGEAGGGNSGLTNSELRSWNSELDERHEGAKVPCSSASCHVGIATPTALDELRVRQRAVLRTRAPAASRRRRCTTSNRAATPSSGAASCANSSQVQARCSRSDTGRRGAAVRAAAASRARRRARRSATPCDRSNTLRGRPPAAPSTMPATLPFGRRPPARAPNRLSTRST